jgi:hypothetical protein
LAAVKVVEEPLLSANELIVVPRLAEAGLREKVEK